MTTTRREDAADPGFAAEVAPPRYVVGVDLGTSNSAVAYVDTHETPWRTRLFPVPQLVAPGMVEARDTLPSCHYQRAAGEFTAGALRLPWTPPGADPDYAVGAFARDQGVAAPGRLIASAKSWLCHSGVDRLAELLPPTCERPGTMPIRPSRWSAKISC
jgi:molecular chaperone DnaK (HSP70)